MSDLTSGLSSFNFTDMMKGLGEMTGMYTPGSEGTGQFTGQNLQGKWQQFDSATDQNMLPGSLASQENQLDIMKKNNLSYGTAPTDGQFNSSGIKDIATLAMDWRNNEWKKDITEHTINEQSKDRANLLTRQKRRDKTTNNLRRWAGEKYDQQIDNPQYQEPGRFS